MSREFKKRRRRQRDGVLEGILKISTEAVIVMDCETRISLFSKGAEAIFGYDEAEILGQPVSVLMPSAFRDRHAGHVEAFASDDAETLVMRQRGSVVGQRKNGEVFALEASLSKRKTPRGLAFTAIVRDTSARERSQEILRQSERRLRIAVQTATLLVFEVDYVAESLFKVGTEEPFFDQPMTYEDLRDEVWCGLHPDHRPVGLEAWRKHQATGAPFRFEAMLNRPSGRETWALITGELEADEAGRPRRLICALQDITERRQTQAALGAALEDAKVASDAKSAFLATMSHEIRTPLNGVLGMAQVMALDELTPAQRARIEVIQQSGQALLAILNDVLDLSKIEAGKLNLEVAEFDLETLVKGAQATFASLASQKGLTFMLDIEAARGTYRGDQTRVLQVLYNLISNAVKFTETGSVTVTARHEADVLRLTIADTGIGMGAAVMGALFAPFYQGDPSMTRRHGGTGLGLSITRRLVELMGGAIAVDSAPGHGSRFVVTLPLIRVSGEEHQAPPSPSRPNPRAARPESSIRVLVAEDNPTNQVVIQTILEQVGLEASVVDNGQLAIEAWRAATYDVILMDVQMPVLDGREATKVIRREEAATARPRIPIIGLTANALARQIAAYRAAGMDAVVTKPIDIAGLLETLSRVLEPATPSLATVP
ncbi:ATP-binding protein [Caulobacter sp.]|uniref:ATP-binding protein n=1 Tax=Caulobacter sp. TaxID=78 RepID=UPI003BAC9516